MMKKRNIAIAMAAVTMASTVAPIVANAATKEVVDNNSTIKTGDTEKFELLRNEVISKLDAKYSSDSRDLNDANLAGENVYIIEVNYKGKTYDINSVEEFDAFISTMKKNEEISISIVDKGHRINEDKIVDWKYDTYKEKFNSNDNLIDYFNQEINGKEVVIGNYNGTVVNLGEKLSISYKDVNNKNKTITLKENGVDLNINEDYKYTAKHSLNNDILNKGNHNDDLFTIDENTKIKDFSKPLYETKSIDVKDGTTEVKYLVGFEDVKLNANKEEVRNIKVQKSDLVSSTDKQVNDLYNEGRFTVEGKQIIDELNTKYKNNKNGKYINVVKNSHGNLMANEMDRKVLASYMYKVIGSNIITTDSGNAKMTLTVKADGGYAHKNNVEVGTTLETMTISGKISDLDNFKNAINGMLSVDNKDITTNARSTNPEVDTYAGSNRYETAANVSEAWNSSKNLVLVAGDAKADGLAATPLAKQLDAPILLTKKDSLPKVVVDRIRDLGVENVYIIGGDGVISKNVEEQLQFLGCKTNRVAGHNRFETSLKIAEKMKSVGSNMEQVFVAGGYAEADALSISAVAAQNDAPVMLVPNTGLTEEQVRFIDAANLNKKAYIVGGDAVVSTDVEKQLSELNISSDRLAGTNRQRTNAKVITEFYGSASLDKLVVAKSDNNGLVDSLAAGALVGKNSDAMLVLATDKLEAEQELALKTLKDKKVFKKSEVGYGIASKVIKSINDIIVKR